MNAGPPGAPLASARSHAWALVAGFCVVSNAIGVLYAATGLEVSPGLQMLLRLLSIVVFWVFLEAECAPYRVAFPMDIGFLLQFMNFVLLPYYLWRTQRWRGMAKMLAVAGIWAATYLLWVGLAWLLDPAPDFP